MQYNALELEEKIRGFWEEKKTPLKLAERRKGAKKFFLLDGPPYINAEPHVGHVKTTVCKDVWGKFKYMQGFDSWFSPGFDCHGLPVEVMVEKELGIESKRQIEEMGIEKFDEHCLKKILNNEKLWVEYYKLIGSWRGWFEPYFTYKPYYIESAWWTAKKLHEKGMLTTGEYPIHWCPHCETALSGYEVSDSYKMVSDPSIFVKFKVKGRTNEFLLVWTTTPWTLPGNVAVFAHPQEKYVKVRVKQGAREELLILAEKRLEQVMNSLGIRYEVVERVHGADLDGLEYEPLLDVPQQKELGAKAHRVYLSITVLKHKKYKKHKMKHDEKEETEKRGEKNAEDDEEEKAEFEEFVTMNEGTGLVHCAPGHGSSDYFVGNYYGLPAVSPVDESGKFTEKAGEWKGLFVKDADKSIVEKLEEEGKLLHFSRITHSYPLCWRCKTPLIFRLSKQWYYKIAPIKEKMIEANERVNWMPSYGKESFGNWLQQSGDWCISQQRYWGIPIPIWVCSSCGRMKVIGSVKELKENAVGSLGELNDLHRHVVDKIRLKCDCGKNMNRVKDIFNVWFDSGIAPWASLAYPFKNKELFEEMFPCDLINESQDQIRGWFYVLMFCSMAAFEKPPYKAVGMMGWVLDEKGEKMSKSLGNVVGAKQAIQELGADATRLYFCYEIAPWDIQKFSFKSAQEVVRALNILWNAFQFYETYAKDCKPAKLSPERLEDKWILSRLNSLAGAVAAHLNEFEFHHAGRKLVEFVMEDFSRWYIKLVRDRVSPSAKGRDKEQCLSVMHHVLVSVAKLFAPITPFLSEHFFQKLVGGDSIHFEPYPVPDEALVDKELEELMLLAMKISEAANAARQETGIKLRWPVKELVVSGDAKVERVVEVLKEILGAANNAHEVSFTDSPKELEEAGFVFKEFAGGKVFLNPERSEELLKEALFREFVRAVQEARKKQGFSVHEHITLWVKAEKPLMDFFYAKREELKSEVSAKRLEFNELRGEHPVEAAIGELKVKAAFSRMR